MFSTQLYIQWQYEYLQVHKKMLNEKKCLRLFNKRTPLCAGLGPKQKHLATAKQLIRKNSACCLRIRQFFSQSKRTDRLDPLPLFVLVRFLRTPAARQTYFLNEPFLWNKTILNLCLTWHILRNYRFVAEITFKNWMQKTLGTIIGEKQKLLKTEYIYSFLLFVT